MTLPALSQGRIGNCITPGSTSGSRIEAVLAGFPAHAMIAERIAGGADCHAILSGLTGWPMFADISPLGCMVGNGSTGHVQNAGISADRVLAVDPEMLIGTFAPHPQVFLLTAV